MADLMLRPLVNLKASVHQPVLGESFILLLLFFLPLLLLFHTAYLVYYEACNLSI